MAIQRGLDIDQRVFPAIELHRSHGDELAGGGSLGRRAVGDPPVSAAGQASLARQTGPTSAPHPADRSSRAGRGREQKSGACRGLTTATAQPWSASVIATSRSKPPVASIVMSVGRRRPKSADEVSDAIGVFGTHTACVGRTAISNCVFETSIPTKISCVFMVCPPGLAGPCGSSPGNCSRCLHWLSAHAAPC